MRYFNKWVDRFEVIVSTTFERNERHCRDKRANVCLWRHGSED